MPGRSSVQVLRSGDQGTDDALIRPVAAADFSPPPARTIDEPTPVPGTSVQVEDPSAVNCDQDFHDAHVIVVAVDGSNPLNADQAARDAQAPVVGVEDEGEGRTVVQVLDAAGRNVPALEDLNRWRDARAAVNVASAMLDGIERTRIAMNNRLRVMPREEGTWRYGTKVKLQANFDLIGCSLLESLAESEERAIKLLERMMKGGKTEDGVMEPHPLCDWVKRTPGLGLKQMGRLLAVLGDPAVQDVLIPNKDDPTNGPMTLVTRYRSVAQLWAYSGLHVVNGASPRNKKGVKSNWNGSIRMRSYLVIKSCIKAVGGETKSGAVRQRSPYRDIYEDRKAYEYRENPEIKKGDADNRAIRYASKMLLRDLWRESMRLHDLAALSSS